MLTNDILKNLRLISIDNFYSESIDAYIEKAYRHYSKTYHTPLHIAKEVVNSAEAILIFMEDELEGLPPDEITQLKERLLNSPRPMIAMPDEAELYEEMDDDSWVAQQMAELERKEKAEKNKAKDSKKEPAATNMADASEQAQKAIQELYQKINKPPPTNLEGSVKFGKE